MMSRSYISCCHESLEMLLCEGEGEGEGEDKGESDSKDEAEYEKIEENAYRINDLARLKITFIYRFFFKK